MSLLIIGGGIAGMTAALACAERGSGPVVVLEREAATFALSSGRNAAIFRPLEVAHGPVLLARRARSIYAALGADLIRQNGLCLVAQQPAKLEPLLDTARALSVPHELWTERELCEHAPLLAGGSARAGIYLPHGGTIDLERVAQTLCARLSEHGVLVRTGAAVSNLEVVQHRVRGVRLESGERIDAERVVNAAGAWAERVAGGAGRALALASHRRHLVRLEPRCAIDPGHPICWNIETEIYFRPDGHLVLACPGDDTPHEPELPSTDPEQVTALMGALAQEAPHLANARVVESWACLRTRSRDGSPLIGPDSGTKGLYWLAGLGGHGMTVGPAAGELLGRSVHQEPDALLESFAVTRSLP